MKFPGLSRKNRDPQQMIFTFNAIVPLFLVQAGTAPGPRIYHLGSVDLACLRSDSSARPLDVLEDTFDSVRQDLGDLTNRVHEINECLSVFAEWAAAKVKPVAKQRHDLFEFIRANVPLISQNAYKGIDQTELIKQHRLVADECWGLERIKQDSGKLTGLEKALKRLQNTFCSVPMSHRLIGCGTAARAKLVVTKLESSLERCKESMTHLGTIPETGESGTGRLGTQLISTAAMVQPILTFIYTIRELETEMDQAVKELTGLLQGLGRDEYVQDGTGKVCSLCFTCLHSRYEVVT